MASPSNSNKPHEGVPARSGGAALRVLLLTVGLGLLGLAAAQRLVDPLALWGTPPVDGLSAHKPALRDHERLSKPHRLARASVEVVLVGSSRVHAGLPARWGGVPEEQVYSAALDGVHVPELEAWLRFLRERPAGPPPVVALGVDLFQVSARARAPRPGFSQERLDILAAGGPRARWLGFTEGVLGATAVVALVRTVAAGLSGRSSPTSLRGADLTAREPLGPEGWARAWATEHLHTYGGFRHSARDQDRLIQAILDLQRAGSRTVLFLPPVHPDLLLSLELQGLGPVLDGLKRDLAQAGPVWDFARVHAHTADRRRFVDPGHVGPALGDAVVAVLSGERSSLAPGYPARLTGDAVEAALAEDAARRRALVAERSEAAALLSQHDTAESLAAALLQHHLGGGRQSR